MGEYIVYDKNNNTNSFYVEFEEIQGSPFLKYILTSTDISIDGDDDEWMDMNRIREMMGEVEFWSDRIFDVIKMIGGHRFTIDIRNDIEFFCIGEFGEKTIELGKLAECYDDCDNCDRFCYNFKNDSPFENNCDCPHYSDCSDIYGKCYDDDGEEYYDSMWDFKCYCTKVNGRDKLLKALGGN